jgi:hypothetical protein
VLVVALCCGVMFVVVLEMSPSRREMGDIVGAGGFIRLRMRFLFGCSRGRCGDGGGVDDMVEFILGHSVGWGGLVGGRGGDCWVGCLYLQL